MYLQVTTQVKSDRTQVSDTLGKVSKNTETDFSGKIREHGYLQIATLPQSENKSTNNTVIMGNLSLENKLH